MTPGRWFVVTLAGSLAIAAFVSAGRVMSGQAASTIPSATIAPPDPDRSGRNVRFVGDFESGAVRAKGDLHDGFSIKTLPDPQANTKACPEGHIEEGLVLECAVTKGGAGPDSQLDTRVVASDTVPSNGNGGNEIVHPRAGNFFLRTAIYFDKDYDGFGGNSRKNKPRTSAIFKDVNTEFDYDVEGWTGFAIYLPQNLEDETGKRGEQGKNMLMNISAPGASEFFTLSYWVPPRRNGGGSDSHWWLTINHSTRSTDRDQTENIDLGSVAPDKGSWTDFVIRWRSNPFAVATNPALAGIPEGRNRLYEGNKGILQLWKAEGRVDSEGNRPMVLKVNKVNAPVGLAPHSVRKLGHSFRQYKHGWHQQRSDVRGPVWIGFDEIRWGLTERDGTGYSDVHPAGLAMPSTAPGVATKRQK